MNINHERQSEPDAKGDSEANLGDEAVEKGLTVKADRNVRTPGASKRRAKGGRC